MNAVSYPLARFTRDAQLPQAADVVVIGGGIIGITAAMELAERGLSVVVCEKGIVAGEQSSRNWGWTRQMGRDERELPLCSRSLALWSQMNSRIGRETGWRRTGISYLSYTKRELADWEKWLDIGKRHGIDARMLSKSEIETMLPGNNGGILGALYTGSDGRAEPWIAVPAMADYAADIGVQIVQNCAVRSVETEGGAVSGVVTEKGTLRTKVVVVAGGAWSRLFLGNMGINFPQLKLHTPVAHIDRLPNLSAMPVGAGDFAYRQRLDETYTLAWRNKNLAPLTPDHFLLFSKFLPTFLSSWREVSLRFGPTFFKELFTKKSWGSDEVTPFEKCRILNPKPVRRFTDVAKRNGARRFPELAHAKILHEWTGVIDATPDAVPVISAYEKTPGLVIASGFSGHGFGIGPAAGEMVADIVTGRASSTDQTMFAFSRFSGKIKSGH